MTLADPSSLLGPLSRFPQITVRAGLALLLGLLLAGGGSGCRSAGRDTVRPAGASPARAPAPVEREIAALTRDLLSLGPGIDEAEARTLARAAIQTARALAEEYRAVRPAWLQNVLVNWGLKPRGLCYQWAEDLEQVLRALPSRQLALHRVVARPGTPREHNALVVYQVNRPPETGLVLDAWRHGGRLHWAPLLADKYPWKLAEPGELPAPGP
jgi:hypothetical protein